MYVYLIDFIPLGSVVLEVGCGHRGEVLVHQVLQLAALAVEYVEMGAGDGIVPDSVVAGGNAAVDAYGAKPGKDVVDACNGDFGRALLLDMLVHQVGAGVAQGKHRRVHGYPLRGCFQPFRLEDGAE